MQRLLYGFTVSLTLLLVACSDSSNNNEENSDLGVSAPGSYIVVLKKSEVQLKAQSMAESFKKSVSSKEVVTSMLLDLSDRYRLNRARQIYSVVLQGGAFEMDKDQAEELSRDPQVAYVERDILIKVQTAQTGATWGLDRLDQASLPLNQIYNYTFNADNVNAYVIDTGIRASHQEFGGRVLQGIDIVDQDNDASDCNGHGTHVAGTIGSSSYGVAKNVKLYGVRVLDCFGSGSYSDVIAGIEWVTTHHVKPAVANMSLGGPVSQAVDEAVAASVQAGVSYVVAAGNENSNACNSSPSRVSTAITVGSTTSTDARSSFSNYGSCVSVFAPGSDIKSTWYNSNSATNTISGTSMASPHVAGVAALYLSVHPNATPAQVKAALLNGSLSGKVSNAGSGSPNRLINVAFLGEDDSGNGGGGGDESGDGGGDGGGGNDPQLSNGVAVGNLTGSSGSERYFTINVPANSVNLTFDISGGTGDADLYVKYGTKPTLLSYDCRPYKNGNTENCTFNAPALGVWHMMLRGYSAYSGVQVKASYQASSQPGNQDPCSNCSRYTGQLSGKGKFLNHPSTSGYQSAAGQQQIWLRGPPGTDFDVYLYKRVGSQWSEVANGTTVLSTEQINYNGTAGTYLIKVISYSGSGSYELWLKKP